jgi:hypothetical protein
MINPRDKSYKGHSDPASKDLQPCICFQDEDELTVLHCAAGEGHEPIVRLLLSSAPYLANEQSK